MAKLMRVLYDFKAEEEGELSVKAGQLVQPKGSSRTMCNSVVVMFAHRTPVYFLLQRMPQLVMAGL